VVALRRLATGLTAFRGDNHIVPIFREIIHGDMIFAIFPLMIQGFDWPWFYDLREIFDAVEQVLQVRCVNVLCHAVTACDTCKNHRA
jgi:hypothetical protein